MRKPDCAATEAFIASPGARAQEGIGRMRMAGMVAIVTGGASGIGRAAASLFAREGAAVVVGDVDVAAGAALQAELAAEGGRALFRRCDVTAEAEVAALIAASEQEFGRLDTIFNNAGIEQPATPSTEVAEALFERVLAVNLKGTFLGCKHAIPALLRAGGGTIVNNASVAAFANVGGNIAYAASKGAVMSLTRVLAVEYAARGIRVNAICPGVIDTAMNQRNLERAPDRAAWMAHALSVTPLGRMGTCEEVAETVLYLASRQSGFVTGAGLVIDGGRIAT
jgi:NAD(P)-dependent dehydrogenase (short-subunit alcohol dehydrogenase family)